MDRGPARAGDDAEGTGLTLIGYHAAHEQFPPSRLLEYARAADDAGFQAAMCSDHFHPWTKAQGESGFTWSWLGAALAATRLSFGTVTVPGWRYHPAVLAQACATLAEMFPGRFWVSVGSGEALNEHITGARWPSKPERNARLKESVDVMRRLWAGEEVSHDGHVRVDRARLYTRPADPPPVFGAALTPGTAAWLGEWADGLITISKPPGKLKEVVDAFRRGGGEGKPMRLQAQLAWDEDEDRALAAAHRQWPFAVLGSSVLATLETPEQFEAATAPVRPEDVRTPVDVSADPAHHVKRLREYADLGFNAIHLHNVVPNQPAFIDMARQEILPAFASG